MTMTARCWVDECNVIEEVNDLTVHVVDKRKGKSSLGRGWVGK